MGEDPPRLLSVTVGITAAAEVLKDIEAQFDADFPEEEPADEELEAVEA